MSLNFDYLLYDGSNESKIGFNVGSEGFLNYSNFPVDEKNKLYSRPEWSGSNFDAVPDKGDANFYVLIDDTSNRADVLGDRGGINFDGMDVVGFGNCYLSDYSINIAVGSFVSCSVNYLCSNLTYDIIGAAEIKAPSVDGQVERSQVVVNVPENALENDFVEYPNDIGESLALRPGDIDVKITEMKNFVATFSSKNIEVGQNFEIDFSQTTGDFDYFEIKVLYPNGTSLKYTVKDKFGNFSLIFDQAGTYPIDVKVIWLDGVDRGLDDFYGPTVNVGQDNSNSGGESEAEEDALTESSDDLPSLSLFASVLLIAIIATLMEQFSIFGIFRNKLYTSFRRVKHSMLCTFRELSRFFMV